MRKPRSVTRANKKKGFPPEEPMSIRNDAGYYDPTPYSRWCEENGFHAENVRNFRSLLAGYGQVDRRRPSPREEKTTVLLGYRLRDYAEPLVGAS